MCDGKTCTHSLRRLETRGQLHRTLFGREVGKIYAVAGVIVCVCVCIIMYSPRPQSPVLR